MILIKKSNKIILFYLFLLISFSFCQKQTKVRSTCTCNFKLIDDPEIKMTDIFPNKVRKSTCDEESIEGCKQLCIKREMKNINGNLNGKYLETDLTHGDIICYWLNQDIFDQDITIEAVLECKNQKFEVDTGLTFDQRLTCESGKFKLLEDFHIEN